MKIIQQNAGFLSNQEVAQVLKDRGADPSAGLNTRAKASEKTVYEYLVSQAGTSLKSRDQLKELLKDLKAFNLSRAEQVQVLNLAPSSAVEVHLVVDNCDQRLREEQVEQLVQTVAKHLGSSSIPT